MRAHALEGEGHGEADQSAAMASVLVALAQPEPEVADIRVPVETERDLADRGRTLDDEGVDRLIGRAAAPVGVLIPKFRDVLWAGGAQPARDGGASVDLWKETERVGRARGTDADVTDARSERCRVEGGRSGLGPRLIEMVFCGLMTAPQSSPAIPGRVWSSAAWLIGGRLVGSACTVALLLLTSHRLSDAAFGRLTFWIAAFLVLDGIVDFGVGQAAVQRTSRAPDELPSVLKTARRARLVVASLVVLGVTTVAFGFEGDGAPFLALASLYQLSHVLELSTIGWRNAILWRSPVLVRAVASLLSLGFVALLALASESRPLVYLAAIAAGSTVGNLALHAFARAHLPRTTGVTPAPARPFLAVALPIGAAAVCQQLYFHIDNLFVRTLLGDEACGHYNVAVRVMSLAIMGGVFAASAALPWLARSHERGALAPAALRLTGATAAGGAAISSLLFPFRELVLSLFGDSFVVASPALAWLLLAAFLVHLGAPLLTAVVARGEGRAVLYIAAAGLAINIAGNAWLLPAHGMVGAAVATVLTEAWVAAAGLFVVLRGADPSVRN